MKKGVYFIFATIVILSGCSVVSEGGEGEEQKQEMPDIVEFQVPEEAPTLTKGQLDLSDAVLGFGIEVFSNLLENHPKEDVVFSPASLSLVLSLSGIGAVGQTAGQISKLLGFDEKSQGEVASYYQTVVGRLIKADESVKFSSANAIWADEPFPIKSTYIGDAIRFFNASVFRSDFSKKNELLSSINNWCETNTNGQIPKFLETAPEAPLVITNALYYKAQWGVVFDEDLKKLTFHGAKGDSEATFFGKTDLFIYQSLPNMQLISLPYGNGSFDFVAMLPAKDKTVSDIVSFLKTADGCRLLSDFGRTQSGSLGLNVSVALPKFEIKADFSDFREILFSMGATLPFDAHKADFSGISQVPHLYINKIIQKAVLNLDEKGTEAAVVSMELMCTTSLDNPEPEIEKFIADRPFVFLVRERSSGSVLFMGVKN